MSTVIPAKCRELITELMDNGWQFLLNHGMDTGGNPYITVEAKREASHVIVTWHTRKTGTYRLFTSMLNKRDVTLARVREEVAA